MDKGVDGRMIDSNIALYLSNLGDVVPLNININIEKTRKELQHFNDEWKQYNPRKPNPRQGLSITSLDGKLSGIPDLDSLVEYNILNNVRIEEVDINVRTPVAEKVESIKPLLDIFDTLGRSHFIRLNQGGFFPMHRDSKILDVSCFRVITLCHNCKRNQFVFIYEDKVLNLKPGVPYFINTRKVHSVFSYVDDSVQCVLNVPLTEKNYKAIAKNLSYGTM